MLWGSENWGTNERGEKSASRAVYLTSFGALGVTTLGVTTVYEEKRALWQSSVHSDIREQIG